MQKATVTLCRNCPHLIRKELISTCVRYQAVSRWEKWKPRFKKPVPTEDEKVFIAQIEENKKKIAKTIGEVEFSVVKALDKSYEIEKYDIFGRGGLMNQTQNLRSFVTDLIYLALLSSLLPQDPFDLAIEEQGGRGDPSQPILVPSVEPSRIVGCVCEKNLKEVKWMRVERGEKKRCECGHWFEMIDVRPDKAEDFDRLIPGL